MFSRLLVPVRLALRAIRRNALRAALTVFGILIGVASVVIVASLGTGARDAVGKQLESIGSNMIFVFPQSKAASGVRSKAGVGRLTEEDGRAIQRDAVSIATVSPVVSSMVQAANGDKTHSAQIQGVTSTWFRVHNWDLVRGSVWSEHDDAVKAKVCILGQTTRERLFGADDPVGHVIRLGRYPCRVVGLLSAKGSLFGRDQDDVVVMPLGAVRSRYARVPPGVIHYFELSATSPETTDRAVDQITSILRQRHHIREGTEPDFGVRTQKAILEVQGQIFGVLTLLLICAAAISLLVGGIGIMNIMLVSVSERTREIGIRMAIGAREGDIRMQFLVEAIVLSLLGGVSGAAIGGVVVSLAAKALGWSMTVSSASLLISLAVSAGIGIAFGFFPARQASRLDPIDALRRE